MLGRWFRSFEHSPCLEKSTSFSGFRGKTPSFSDLWIDLLKQILKRDSQFRFQTGEIGVELNSNGTRYIRNSTVTKFQFRNSTATDCCDKPSIFWFWSFREIGHVENVGAWAPRGVQSETHLLDFEILHFSPHTLGEPDVFFKKKSWSCSKKPRTSCLRGDF